MRLLVVEDEELFRDSLVDWLGKDYELTVCVDGKQAADILSNSDFDIIVLDVGLPILDGFEVCRQYRENGGQAAILFLTGKNETDDKVSGLDAGADDYLTKPFSLQELSARLRALRRRSGILQSNKLQVEKLILDLKERSVSYDSRSITLSPQEFMLLEFLMRHKGQVFNQKELIERVWDSSAGVSGESVRKSVARLRKSLSQQGADQLVKTITGVGYKIDDEAKTARKLPSA